MKKIKIIGIIALFVVSNFAISQETEIEALLNTSIRLNDLEDPKDVDGSPYTDETFKIAKIDISDRDFLIRYNTYHDMMEVKVNDSIFVIPKNLKYSITFINPKKTYKLFQINDIGQLQAQYFIVVKEMEGKSLLLKETIVIEPEKLPKNGFDPYKGPTYKREKDKLYIAYKNNLAEELPSNKKDIINLFGSKAKIVEKEAKKMKWSFNKNSDLIEIFNFYYSLD
jgi:hypothetical protein